MESFTFICCSLQTVDVEAFTSISAPNNVSSHNTVGSLLLSAADRIHCTAVEQHAKLDAICWRSGARGRLLRRVNGRTSPTRHNKYLTVFNPVFTPCCKNGDLVPLGKTQKNGDPLMFDRRQKRAEARRGWVGQIPGLRCC